MLRCLGISKLEVERQNESAHPNMSLLFNTLAQQTNRKT